MSVEWHTSNPTNKLLKCAAFVVSSYGTMTRLNSDTPFAEHAILTAQLMTEFTHDVDVLCAAMLKNILNKTKKITYEDILREFGPEVANLVQELSRNEHKVVEMGLVKYLRHKFSNCTTTLIIECVSRIDLLNDIKAATENDEYSKYVVEQTIDLFLKSQGYEIPQSLQTRITKKLEAKGYKV